jgi:hypothetical protein
VAAGDLAGPFLFREAVFVIEWRGGEHSAIFSCRFFVPHGPPELISTTPKPAVPAHQASSLWPRYRLANRHCGVTQPAMCRVGVHAGIPHRRYDDLRRTDGKVEANQPLPNSVSG